MVRQISIQLEFRRAFGSKSETLVGSSEAEAADLPMRLESGSNLDSVPELKPDEQAILRSTSHNNAKVEIFELCDMEPVALAIMLHDLLPVDAVPFCLTTLQVGFEIVEKVNHFARASMLRL